MIEKSNGSTRAIGLAGRDERLRSPLARAEWLARFERSGLSLAAFCREQHLPYWTLRYWQRRARQTDRTEGKLVEVPARAVGGDVRASSEAHRSTAVAIRLPNGIELEVCGGCEPRWLAALVREVLACSP
jgi:hypothetical protein